MVLATCALNETTKLDVRFFTVCQTRRVYRSLKYIVSSLSLSPIFCQRSISVFTRVRPRRPRARVRALSLVRPFTPVSHPLYSPEFARKSLQNDPNHTPVTQKFGTPRALLDLRDEVAVVADDDERAVEVAERVFEGLLGGDVEVVGRFVEEEHVGLAEHHGAQRHARLLAACV